MLIPTQRRVGNIRMCCILMLWSSSPLCVLTSPFPYLWLRPYYIGSQDHRGGKGLNGNHLRRREIRSKKSGHFISTISEEVPKRSLRLLPLSVFVGSDFVHGVRVLLRIQWLSSTSLYVHIPHPNPLLITTVFLSTRDPSFQFLINYFLFMSSN